MFQHVQGIWTNSVRRVNTNHGLFCAFFSLIWGNRVINNGKTQEYLTIKAFVCGGGSFKVAKKERKWKNIYISGSP